MVGKGGFSIALTHALRPLCPVHPEALRTVAVVPAVCRGGDNSRPAGVLQAWQITGNERESDDRKLEGVQFTKWSKPYTLQDFPWEIRLAKKKTSAMTRSISRKRRPEEEEEDEMED
eukprot:s24_g56.t1